ncbi:MAG: alpha/beta hydrolase [Burkholderiales bacterium]|nr:alpha/beta hydrolase [Burkholderiales bacterium]ODU71988.1 MAG: acetylxylan esterase [Lautropia sp. SCN 66-9]
MYREIEFRSEDTIIRGRLYAPREVSGPAPVIIMAPGFGGLIQHSPVAYAEVFAAAGLAVLVYDHPRFGASDGQPRQDADPVLQRRTYRDAISYAQTLPEVDPLRIGLWGSSYGGGHVLEVAAQDPRVRCVVSQVPTISGFAQARRRMTADAMKAMRVRFDEDRARRLQGAAPATLPLVSIDPAQPGYFNTRAAYDNYMQVPEFVNRITLRSIEMNWENEPAINIERVSPRPLLMIVADEDEATPSDLALGAYQRALEPKQLMIVKGGHFSPYHEHLERTSAAARDWFLRHLKG